MFKLEVVEYFFLEFVHKIGPKGVVNSYFFFLEVHHNKNPVISSSANWEEKFIQGKYVAARGIFAISLYPIVVVGTV